MSIAKVAFMLSFVLLVSASTGTDLGQLKLERMLKLRADSSDYLIEFTAAEYK